MSLAFCLLAIGCAGSAEVYTSNVPLEQPSAQGNAKIYLDEITRNYNAVHETDYQTTTSVNEHTGVFKYDCSGLNDYAFERVLPDVYQHFKTVLGTGFGTRLSTEKLTTFFNALDPQDPYWTLVPNLESAISGDLLVYRHPGDRDGHVVTVRRNLGHRPDSRDSEILLEIFDSAESRHSSDHIRHKGATTQRDDMGPGGTKRTGLGFGVMSFSLSGGGYRWRGTEADSPLQGVHSMHLARLKAGPAPAIPPAPENLKATSGKGKVALKWARSSGAVAYTIKRGTTDGGPYETLYAELVPEDFVDTSGILGTTYYYVVSAFNATGQSADSAQVSAAPK